MRTSLAIGVLLTLAAMPAAQEPQTPRFRVAVDAVRIDAVVTDKDGNVVRDLTADDFEVSQDGKPQKVTFAQFVAVTAGVAIATPAPKTLKGNPVVGAPPLPAAGAVKRENIQRTLAVVVDDLAMSVESLYYVKRGLHDFIDKSLQPSDLVALVRTGGSMDGLQPFTTDRRVLHAAVDNLKWNAFSRSGVEAFQAVNQFMQLDDHATFSPDDFKALDNFRGTVMAAGTLGALNLVIHGARDLPGRKAILFVSEGFSVLEGDTKSPDPRVRSPLDRATTRRRAPRVIYSIDARGLQTGALLASDNLKVGSLPGQATATCHRRMERSARTSRTGRIGAATRRKAWPYLAEQTGGFAVLNTNDLGAGLARASQDVRDYYVIGYEPEANTFAGKGKTPQYHKISVRLKRQGLKIRTRKEFLGVSDADESAAPETPVQQLVNAAISPFTATDIAVRTTLLPGFSPDRGLFVRALLHIDASALTFTKETGGEKTTASADVLGMVFDRDGTEVGHLSTGFEVALTSAAAEDALRDGLAYTLRIPIPRAGPYQVRFAVRDRQSAKVGTAGEFINIADVPHGVFASGIVIAATTCAGNSGGRRPDRHLAVAGRPRLCARRIEYACEIYNAAAPVQVAISVWRGNEGPERFARRLSPPPGQSLWFAAGGAFKLRTRCRPTHVLRSQPPRPIRARKSHRAVQTMDFGQVKIPQLHVGRWELIGSCGVVELWS
jgi:VWFA-related protein